MSSHSVNLKWIEHREEVLAKLNRNAPAALQAMGLKAVELTVDKMNSYPRRIYRTGDLQRDVNYKVDGNTVIVGNSLDYAIPVHEGTSKMAGRPYLRDALEGKGKILGEIAGAYLKDGF